MIPGETDDPMARRAEAQALRGRLQRTATLLDAGIGVPGTRWRIGIEALIGMVPVVGDLFGVLLGSYFLVEGVRIGAPRSVLLRMTGNVLFDLVIGLVPVVGDLADFAFKSNSRNAALLDRHLDQLLQPAPVHRRRSRVGWWLAAAALAVAGLIAWTRWT